MGTEINYLREPFDVLEFLTDPFFQIFLGIVFGTYGLDRLVEMARRRQAYGDFVFAMGKGMTARMFYAVNVSSRLIVITVALGVVGDFLSVSPSYELLSLHYQLIAAVFALWGLFLVSYVYITMISRAAKQQFQTPLWKRLAYIHKEFSKRGFSEFELIGVPIVLVATPFLSFFAQQS